MRWYALLPLPLVFLLVTATSSPDQAEDLGQATLTMHATISGHSHWTDKDCKCDDEVTITVTERVLYRIARIRSGALDLEIVSHQNSFSASGGGTVKGKNCDSAWTYHIKDHMEDSVVSVWVNLGIGRGAFLIGDSFIKDADLSSTHVVAGYTAGEGLALAGYAAWKVADEPFMAISQAAKDFMKQLEFSFKPYSKDVSVHRSADYAYQLPTPETPASAELHMDFSLVTGAQEDSEAEIIPPKEYTHWMPKAGDDEEKPGNTIKVEARIYKKGDPTKPSSKKARFKFELVDVSKEKGVCLNWPEIAKDDFDLKIEKRPKDSLEVAEDGQSARSAAGVSESTVTITSHDWGAYGKLRVIAIFDDGSEVNAHVKGDQSKYSLTIPKDDNVNHIADIWEKLFPIGSYDAKADDDLYPIGDNSLGDGLSLYEEYRGFWIQGHHEYTSPIQKDLFVFDRDELGTGDFALSGLTIHLIKVKEAGLESTEPNPFVINHNRGLLTRGPQHILRIINAEAEGYLGLTYGFGTPKDIRIIKIDLAKCDKQSPDWKLRTIAHELAHGCHVDHHGNSNYKASELEVLDPLSGSWLKSDEKGPFSVAAQGQQESGVEKCIMRYCGEILYENPNGEWRWKKPPTGEWQRGEFYGEGEDTGHIFCDDPKGTGVNAPQGYQGVSKAGNATKGNCKGQFCVNDNKH